MYLFSKCSIGVRKKWIISSFWRITYYNIKIRRKVFISGDFNCRCGPESNDILNFDKNLDGDSDLFIDLPFRNSKDSIPICFGVIYYLFVKL